MKKLRKEDLSLIHYLRFNVLTEYVEWETSVPLTYLPDVSTTGSYVYESTSNMDPTPTSLGRGWVYLDAYEDNTEQQNSVIVRDDTGTIVSGSEYMIDYVDGRVITSGSFTPGTVDYKYFYVAIVNEWGFVETAGAPVVVVDLSSFNKEGFQLGGGRRVPRKGRLFVFASDRAERDDITEMLYDGIYQKCVPNQNWPKGSLIDWNGTFNDDYVYETIQYHSQLQFENVSSKNIYPPMLGGIPRTDVTMLSDLNRYRSRIDFEMFHYEEY